MPQTEDSASPEPQQAAPLRIMLPQGFWLELPDTWTKTSGIGESTVVLPFVRRLSVTR